jgi:hypothetical protein
MPLKIVKASEPIRVERLNVVIYGPPGIGKSSIAFTASKPLLLDFDGGAHRAANRKDIVRVTEWSDVSGITADDLAPFDTIILDTAGRGLDCLTNEIIKTEPKGHKNGALTLPGFGILKSRFISFLKLLNSFGKDVVLIAHMNEQRNGDELIERIDMQGASKDEVYKAADAMGRMVIEGQDRWVKFSPTDAAFGKNPGQLDPLKVPHPSSTEFDGFLARVIQQTKDRLNELTEDQRKAVAEQTEFRGKVAAATDADGVNALLDTAKASAALKPILHARAVEIGLAYDKTAGKYVAPPAEAAKEPAPAETEKAA